MKHKKQYSQEKRADILLVGIGGGGGNALSRLIGAGRLGNRVDTLAMNTDMSPLMLHKSSGMKILQLGKNSASEEGHGQTRRWEKQPCGRQKSKYARRCEGTAR